MGLLVLFLREIGQGNKALLKKVKGENPVSRNSLCLQAF